MKGWLTQIVNEGTLDDETQDYLLGRGAQSDTINRMQLFQWDKDQVEVCPSSNFADKYGPRGNNLHNMLVTPVMSPRHEVLGIEARNIHRKQVLKHYLPASKWTPTWVGVQEATQRLWQGARVWIVEGIFDLFAMEWVVPDTDVVFSSSRAGLTRRHVDYLARYAREGVYVVYDNDETGRNATTGHTKDGRWMPGIIHRLTKAGVPNVVDFRYQGKDPGEVWDHGGVPNLKQVFGHIH